jgi:dolichol kinase
MNELARKAYRFSALAFPLLYALTSRRVLVSVLGGLTVALVTLEVLRFAAPRLTSAYFRYFSWVAKERERTTVSGTTYLVASALLVVVLFSQPIAILAMVYLVLGDGVAALAARRWHRIPFGNKSLEASGAMLLACLAAGAVLVSSGLGVSWYAMAGGALAGTLIEPVPLYIPTRGRRLYLDDNFTIGLTAGAAMSLISHLLGVS